MSCALPLQVFWAERKSTPDLRSLAEQLAADPEAGKARRASCAMQLVRQKLEPVSYAINLRLMLDLATRMTHCACVN